VNKYLLLLLVLICRNTFGQVIIIDDNVVYKRGIYKDFEEFKFNRPSLPFDYKIDSVEYQNLDVYTNASSHTTYRIVFDKSGNKQLGSIFGFCDGKHIFVNESNPTVTDKTDFDQLQFVGLYSYFEQYMFMPGELGSLNSSTVLGRIVNINNGECSVVTQEVLNKVFENDSTILSSFNSQKDKRAKLKDYIALYSLKHKDDGVICRDKKMSKAEADSFIVRRQDDITDQAYYSRLSSKLKTNPAFNDAKLEISYYPNGVLKSIGFNTRCNFDPNDQFLYCIGMWKFYYDNGQLKEEDIYSISSKTMSRKKFDKNGTPILK